MNFRCDTYAGGTSVEATRGLQSYGTRSYYPGVMEDIGKQQQQSTAIWDTPTQSNQEEEGNPQMKLKE